MNRKSPEVAALACLLLCSCGAIHEPPEVEPAPYVFLGTVLEARSSTVPLLPPSDETYTVRVDEILFQKGVFADLTGSGITVVDPRRGLKSGGKYLFYAEPVLFGRSVAVRLVEARRGERPDPASLREAQERQELRTWLQRADFVASGRIDRVEPVRQERRLLTEHWPDLHLAVLSVDRVLKGEASGDRIEFLFAASRDVHWYQAPKVKDGDTGIFLLEAGSSQALALEIGAGRYTLFQPMGVQPLERLNIIEELLQ